MSRAIPFQSYMALPTPRWNDQTKQWDPYAPAGTPLDLVQRAVLAMYVDRHRQGHDEITIAASDFEAVIGMKRRAIEYARASLVEQGLLVVVRQSIGGRGKPTSYRLGERVLHSFRNPAPRAQFDGGESMSKPRTTRGVQAAEPRTTCEVDDEKPRTTRGVLGEKPRTETPHPDPINPAPHAPSLERDPRARTRGSELVGFDLAESSAEGRPSADAPGSDERPEQRPTRQSTSSAVSSSEITGDVRPARGWW